jgi:syringomycin synthetase protein SyrE
MIAGIGVDLPFNPPQETTLLSNWWRRVNGDTEIVTNLVECRRLSGALDIATLEVALTRLVERHVTLRTTVHSIHRPAGGVTAWPSPRRPESLRASELFYQRVELPRAFPLTPRDLGAVSGDLLTRALHEQCSEEAGTPFALSRAPLARGHLFRCAPEDHILILCIPHYATDALSMQVCWRDLLELYEAAVARREPALPLVPDFHECVRRQWARDATGAGEATIAYWREQWTGMTDEPSVSPADLDFVRPLVSARGVRRDRYLVDPDLAAAIRQIAQRCQSTPATLFFAAFTRWLQLRTGRARLSPWLTFANRTGPGAWDMVGYFATAIAVPVHVDVALSRHQHLIRCRTLLAGAVQHQDVRRDHLWRDLGVTTIATQMRFTYLSAVASVTQGATLAMATIPELVEAVQRHSGFDVTIGDHRHTFSVNFLYGAGRFRPADVKSAFEQYQRLLLGFADGDASLATLE